MEDNEDMMNLNQNLSDINNSLKEIAKYLEALNDNYCKVNS